MDLVVNDLGPVTRVEMETRETGQELSQNKFLSKNKLEGRKTYQETDLGRIESTTRNQHSLFSRKFVLG